MCILFLFICRKVPAFLFKATKLQPLYLLNRTKIRNVQSQHRHGWPRSKPTNWFLLVVTQQSIPIFIILCGVSSKYVLWEISWPTMHHLKWWPQNIKSFEVKFLAQNHIITVSMLQHVPCSPCWRQMLFSVFKSCYRGRGCTKILLFSYNFDDCCFLFLYHCCVGWNKRCVLLYFESWSLSSEGSVLLLDSEY